MMEKYKPMRKVTQCTLLLTYPNIKLKPERDLNLTKKEQSFLSFPQTWIVLLQRAYATFINETPGVAVTRAVVKLQVYILLHCVNVFE